MNPLQTLGSRLRPASLRSKTAQQWSVRTSSAKRNIVALVSSKTVQSLATIILPNHLFLILLNSVFFSSTVAVILAKLKKCDSFTLLVL